MRPLELTERLAGGPLLLDGGLGTVLIGLGLEPGRAPEWWTLEQPERVRAAHRGYVDAGSDVIHSNTFGASPPKLEAAGLGGRCRELNRLAVELAREAAGTRVLVAGDVGPTGCLLPPTGTASPAELEDAFAAQTQALAEAGVDLLSLETMYDLREALAATRAAVATKLPVLCSMTFEVRPRGIFTIMGDELTAALGALAEAGAHAIGFNCSVTSSVMIQMVTRARAAMTLPLVAQPNAGQPRATAQGIVYDARPEEFAADLLRMVTEGARIVGGCCGTTPAFISAARQALIGGGALAGPATPQ